MDGAGRRSHLSFQAKVLIPVITVMVLLLATTMWMVNRRIARQLENDADGRLRASETAFKSFSEIRDNNLKLAYRNVANEPRLKAIARLSDPKTAQAHFDDLIKEIGLEELHTDVIILTSPEVGRLASTRRDSSLDVAALERSSSESTGRALDGEERVDIIPVGNRLFDVISIPVTVSGEVVGALTWGAQIGETVAKEFGEMTGCGIVFLANDHVTASTLQQTELNTQLVSFFNEYSPLFAPDKSFDSSKIRKIMLGDEHFRGLTGRFATSSGDNSLGYLLLSSYEQPLRVLQETRHMLLMLSLAGMLFSTFIVLAAVRRVTAPLRQLRDGAEAVGRGDFSRRVLVTSHDECGELATTFNQMTENLKTSRDQLEKTVETLKTTQAQLIQSEKVSAIGEFVAGVAHELNNPLTSVMGFAQLLQQSDTNPQHQRFLDRIFSEARRCSKIVRSLLSFARQHAPERKRIDFNENVNAAVEILRYQLRTSGIEVITELHPSSLAVMADSHQIQQVFVNIINNARQAMEGQPSKGLLRITTEPVGKRARVTFQDNGPGISPENLEKIFDPFFTTKGVGKGTGLGLSLSHGIIQEHGGTLTVKSKSGEGAAFIIDLPIAQGNASTESETAATPLAPDDFAGDGKKVLVVDDEDSILELAREILTAAHFSVDTANDGKSALRKLRQNRYDLTVCDLKMPDLSGQQIYELLRSTNPEAASRLIFMTGDVVNEQTREFFERHGKICLAKPFSLEDFRAVFKNVLPTS